MTQRHFTFIVIFYLKAKICHYWARKSDLFCKYLLHSPTAALVFKVNSRCGMSGQSINPIALERSIGRMWAHHSAVTATFTHHHHSQRQSLTVTHAHAHMHFLQIRRCHSCHTHTRAHSCSHYCIWSQWILKLCVNESMCLHKGVLYSTLTSSWFWQNVQLQICKTDDCKSNYPRCLKRRFSLSTKLDFGLCCYIF